MNGELELEVFRAGDYGPKGEWSEEALQGIAADYDPDFHEAPVTLDHAQSGPALGWVAGVRRCGDRLVARLRGVSETLMNHLREGRFKKRSVEIYRSLPETGKPYLKAVSFLGAGAPAVKGLRDALFTDEEPSSLFRSELGEHCAFDFAERSAPAAASDRAEAGEGSRVAPTAAFADEAFAELERELREAGRWIPSWEERGLRDFFGALAAFDEVEVAEGGRVVPAEWFAEFLKSLPAYLPMGEAAPARTFAATNTIPQGPSVSPSSVELHREVVAMRGRRPELSYAEALRECARETSA